MSQALLIDDQCAIPAFDGLFPNDEDNKNILGLLFLLSTWHAYVKLRLHTDTTLEMFESICTVLCQALRHFAAVTCPRYATKELPREADARARTAIRNKATNASTTTKTKKFNMTTFKLHCIPDYPLAIRQYGTTDSYSTQIVSRSHRDARYRCTTESSRASWHTVYVNCIIGYQIRTADTPTRSPKERAVQGSTVRCPRNRLKARHRPPPQAPQARTLATQQAARTNTLKTEMLLRPISLCIIGCLRPLRLAQTSPNGYAITGRIALST